MSVISRRAGLKRELIEEIFSLYKGVFRRPELWIKENAVPAGTQITPLHIRWHIVTNSDRTLLEITSAGKIIVLDEFSLKKFPSDRISRKKSPAADGTVKAMLLTEVYADARAWEKMNKKRRRAIIAGKKRHCPE